MAEIVHPIIAGTSADARMPHSPHKPAVPEEKCRCSSRVGYDGDVVHIRYKGIPP